MSTLSNLKATVGIRKAAPTETRSIDEEKEHDVHVTRSADEERHGSNAFHDSSKGTDVPVEETAQRGVQKVEAATSAWSKPMLAAVLVKYAHLYAILAYLLANLWLQYLANLLDKRNASLDPCQLGALCD